MNETYVKTTKDDDKNDKGIFEPAVVQLKTTHQLLESNKRTATLKHLRLTIQNITHCNEYH